MWTGTRRDFLSTTAAAMAGAGVGLRGASVLGQEAGERPARAEGVTVLNPQKRVPLSLIIDDSTCLVNLAHFCIPHFHEVYPERYPQPWRTLPREIPDAFVRKFATWCREHGVKGKYSVIPNPACVGWLDRDLPGWSRRELHDSLELLRTELATDWDFHPEMVTHTWVIDTKTGRPYPERTERFIENWGWSAGRSVDELADYMTYAMRILKNVAITCQGITTPGGFGSRAKAALAQATIESCRDVFNTEIPHYFRDGYTDERSVAPRVEYASGLDGPNPKCVVSIVCCTDDWFGGWDGLTPGSVDRLITKDLKGGRMTEVIQRGEPALPVCHWPGFYYNGEERGFDIFKESVRRLHARFDNLIWMKLSEISRYWAARELTRIERRGRRITFHAPFACPRFTVNVTGVAGVAPTIAFHGQARPLARVARPGLLASGSWTPDGAGTTLCFDLPRGPSTLTV